MSIRLCFNVLLPVLHISLKYVNVSESMENHSARRLLVHTSGNAITSLNLLR